MNFKELLINARNEDNSDIHFKVGTPPVLRKYGKLIFCELEKLTEEDIDEIVEKITDKSQREQFKNTQELDFAFDLPDTGRFRANLYREKGNTAIAIRVVSELMKGTRELNLPIILEEWALRSSGFILCTGAAGSGKSTTIAAMIEYINNNISKNIITIEDPIEYVFKDKKSIISQREVGTDTHSFADALKHAFREDPDVIFVGEMRDIDTVDISLKAADTGHLVVSTLHTLNASETINRIVSFFPPHQHQHIRRLLAATLVGIVSLRLIPRADGKGRIPATEVIVVTERIKDCILEPEKIKLIAEAIEDGKEYYNMQSFDDSIMSLYKKDLITHETAIEYVTNVDDFERKLHGIKDEQFVT